MNYNYPATVLRHLNYLVLALFLSLFLNNAHSKDNYHETLTEYINLIEPVDTSFKLVKKSVDQASQVTLLEYTFTSQVWPKVDSDQKAWQHVVNIYVPENINNQSALVWINGGTNIPKKDGKPSPYVNYNLDFSTIAKQTHTVVVDLQDIPNQYFTLDNKELVEDALTAYTATKFIQDPIKYKYYSAYLPMVKAVIKALDNTQKINFNQTTINKNNNIVIKDFILSGLSKRGLTTWLTALQDDRIKAIIPVAIDILNTEQIITHIFNSYQSWPQALHDYSEQNMLQNLNNSNAKDLMHIIDPYQYITCHGCSDSLKDTYKQRANIDKYIILSSGDDFFVPDSLKFYFHDIPGQKYLTFIPNSYHYVNNKILSNIILSYLYIINNPNNEHITIPTQASKIKKNITSKNKYDLIITTNTKPKVINLYTAYNRDKRDFRLAMGIKYKKTPVSIDKFNRYKRKKYNQYVYTVNINKPESGWKASFVELEYNLHPNKNIPNLKLTTPVEILPSNYPEIIKRAIKNETREIIHYGKEVLYPNKD